MNLSQILNRYKTVYLSFKESEKEELIEKLKAEGFKLPLEVSSPIKLHQDKSVSFISGFCEGMLYSADSCFKKSRPDCIKIDCSKITINEIESAWYKNRKR